MKSFSWGLVGMITKSFLKLQISGKETTMILDTSNSISSILKSNCFVVRR